MYKLAVKINKLNKLDQQGSYLSCETPTKEPMELAGLAILTIEGRTALLICIVIITTQTLQL